MRARTFIRWVGVELGLLVMSGGLLFSQSSAPTAPEEVRRPAGVVMKSVADLTDDVRPSLVKVSQVGREGVDGIGSGFVVSADGLIATNLHVIGEARDLRVETGDGVLHEVVEVHATDSHADLAVLRVKPNGGKLKPLGLGDSDRARQGDPIVAMGAPEGLAFSVVEGVLSGKRDIDDVEMLQVAVPIERGNSGGPLLDRKGNVLGLLTLKSLRTDNLGFAMPVNALKKLLAEPNPIPMSRWLTIGALDGKRWKTVMGARWMQHAGVIRAETPGTGFGGRALCLSLKDKPEGPFEAAVMVKLDDESGAAGLVFCSDGGDVHYGFYPSGGKLRLTRFDGADVYSWTILADMPTPSYKQGDWNHLRVSVNAEKITCYVNGAKLLEQADTGLRGGWAGICKFRNTSASFRGFKVGDDLSEKAIEPEIVEKVSKAVDGFLGNGSTEKAVSELLDDPSSSRRVLRERRGMLERQAAQLRDLEKELHRRAVTQDLLAELAKPEDKINVLRCALLLSRHDNPDIDVAQYLQVFNHMVDDLRADPELKKGTNEAVARINRYLFEENGFHGSRNDYANKSNSYVNEVLDDREGLPITLSVVYLELAARLGIKDVFGAGLPGKFMVGFHPKSGSDDVMLVDVFERGKMLTVAAAQGELNEGVPFDPEMLEPASKKSIVMRMLKNLVSLTMEDAMPSRDSAPYVNLVLALEPGSPAERFARARLREMDGDKTGAREDVGWLLENGEQLPPYLYQQLDRWYQSLK
ncbi:MAG: trypsin-like peptidase domain-containing protein [Verrucomicrobiaceae bacterium]|nr:trypsin-like peptidase domain-containing protein [Verrucomicrobiaceae bacterium]